jgi:hypothetical protein
MYKLVANNAIMKFPVILRKGFQLEKDELRFGFNLKVEIKRDNATTIRLSIPIMINTGIMKVNNPSSISSS